MIFFDIVKDHFNGGISGRKSFIEFVERVIMFSGCFKEAFIKLNLLLRFLYNLSRKLTSIKSALISILETKLLNVWMIYFTSVCCCPFNDTHRENAP